MAEVFELSQVPKARLGTPVGENMRLATVRVTEFKSIKDSGTFQVGDVTCLVGRNESGKTALLQALYRLNPIIEGQGIFDVTEDYPRAEEEEY